MPDDDEVVEPIAPIEPAPGKKVSPMIGEIRKGIDIPPAPKDNGNYPWNSMDVGDSVVIIGSTIGGVTRSANAYAKKHNESAKFEFRQIGDNSIGAWRMA